MHTEIDTTARTIDLLRPDLNHTGCTLSRLMSLIDTYHEMVSDLADCRHDLTAITDQLDNWSSSC